MKRICTKQNNCQPYLKLQNNLDKSKKTITDYLNKFRCNSTNTRDIYVCCEKDEEKDIDNTVFNVERTLENAPDSKICGRQTANTDKIFGGTSAALGEFPWIALLQYPSNSGLMSGCGGSLINSRYVLTAAHCVDADILKSRRLQPL
ncbi:hypothetical protein NQ314_013499 [Rhamnusium bicolor]|uniref:CLIP domain-containing serine protease n=1 Tax=Rhamnusium bicolor TaxID=1586634 RepID=A0AAV8X620_9CUCU|nr:hypothetical protein NQ314_013499 [Rhamnusium bicolor]